MKFRSRYKNKKPVVHVPLTFHSEPGTDIESTARVRTEGVSDDWTDPRKKPFPTPFHTDPGHGQADPLTSKKTPIEKNSGTKKSWIPRTMRSVSRFVLCCDKDGQ